MCLIRRGFYSETKQNETKEEKNVLERRTKKEKRTGNSVKYVIDGYILFDQGIRTAAKVEPRIILVMFRQILDLKHILF